MRNKILIILPIVLCTLSIANAQDNNAASIKQTEVIVNGKPYSQYKAEQDALKKQQEANKVAAVPNANLVTINASDAKPTPAKVQPATEKSSENNGNTQPVPAVDASLTVKKVDAVTKPQPEVPEQFKLAAATPWDGKPINNAKPATNLQTNTTIKSDPAQAIDAKVMAETYVSKPLTDNTHSAEEQKRAAQNAAYVPPAPVKVKAATEKNEATVPALPQGLKLETGGGAIESKPAESKTQPVAIPNSPNAAKTKTD